MLEGEREKLLRMEEQIEQRVVGQHEAVRAVSDAIRRSRAGLSDPQRPIGSFLFLGPTGVGRTSNLGSDIIQQKAGEANYADMKDAVMEIVRQAFRPEFINRLDEIVVFHPLDEEQIRAIARIQIGYLKHRLADRDMQLDISDAALDLLGEAGFDPVYGARPLKRAIRAQLENPLAQEILSGHFKPGDTVQVDVQDGQLSFGATVEAELVD
jgi:ATP-dependent Clp protease ATP-binding subunit ClpB